MLAKYRNRRNHGASLLETPGVIMLIFLGFCFPLIGMMVFSYRASLLYFCLRDTAYQASTSPTFTLAQTNANTTWKNDTASWTGITPVGNPTLTIIITVNNPTGGLSTSTSATKLGTVNTATNIYFMQTVGTATIQPLLGSGWKVLFMSNTIPGLNAPYTMQMSQQLYVENPNGLTL